MLTNALLLIVVTELGIVIGPVNPEQFSNRLLLMMVSELGNVREPVNL
jgi:hypothetical protein